MWFTFLLAATCSCASTRAFVVNVRYLASKSFKCHENPPRESTDLLPSTVPPVADLKQLSTSELIETLSNYNPNNFSDEVKMLIDERAKAEAPSELEVRMQILGINKFTIAGFALAAFLIIMNTIFGNGWLGDLVGYNKPIPTLAEVNSVNNPVNQAKIQELRGKSTANYNAIVEDVKERLRSEGKYFE